MQVWGDTWESARRKGKREPAKLQHSPREECTRYSIYLLYQYKSAKKLTQIAYTSSLRLHILVA